MTEARSEGAAETIRSSSARLQRMVRLMQRVESGKRRTAGYDAATLRRSLVLQLRAHAELEQTLLDQARESRTVAQTDTPTTPPPHGSAAITAQTMPTHSRAPRWRHPFTHASDARGDDLEASMTRRGWLAALDARWDAVRAFALMGTICVISGGLVAAATAPSRSEGGAWAAAYLVLVAGVAQIALGAGQALLAAQTPDVAVTRIQVATWTLGSIAVIGGTLSRTLLVADLGSVLLLVTLAMSLLAVRHAHVGRGIWWYRALIVLLGVSMPTGLVLARVRPL